MINMQEFQDFMEMWSAYKVFQQMQQPTQPMPNPMVQMPTPAQQTSGTVEVIHNNHEVESLRQQLADLKAQLAAKDLEIASLRQAQEAQRHEAQEREGQIRTMSAELAQLKSDIATVEAYNRADWEDYVGEIRDMSGQEYYDEHREEWYAEGMSGSEMYREVKAFKEATKQDGTQKMVDFEDEARFSPHRAEEKVERAKEEVRHKNPTGVMREVKDGPADRDDFDF